MADLRRLKLLKSFATLHDYLVTDRVEKVWEWLAGNTVWFFFDFLEIKTYYELNMNNYKWKFVTVYFGIFDSCQNKYKSSVAS